MIYHTSLTSLRQLGLLLPLILVVTGCGQPGPLYLPSKTPPVPVEAQTKPQMQPEIKKDQ